MGLSPLVSEPCLYTKVVEGKEVRVLIYVDDILIAGTKQLVKWIKEEKSILD